jgi:integrase
MLVKVALGDATPIETFTEAWLKEKDIEERSKGEYRLAVSEVIAWAKATDRLPTLETFDRKAAGAYVTALRGRAISRATAGKRLSALSSLWAWLGTKGHVEMNVWRGHGAGAVTRSERQKEPERPFTDDEMRLLMGGSAKPVLADLMRIAALSGMRLEEIGLLRVRDVDLKAGTMAVRDPKTPASRRAVPIHPDLLATVTTRTVGRDKDAFLLSELGPEPKAGRQRTMAISKAFGRYRVDVGVHDARPGQRRALTNFHSFRRWFITKAEQAGQQETIIRSVVGHKRAGVTLGTYSGGASLEQRRACVEAVRLP